MEKITSIKILGSGCKTCKKQLEIVKKSLAKLNYDVEPEYITDISKVMEYGVMSMPAIIINEKIVSCGRLVYEKEVEKLIKEL